MRESNKISFIQSEKDKNVEEYNIIYLKKEISPTNLAPINDLRCFSNKEKEINNIIISLLLPKLKWISFFDWFFCEF